MDPTLHSETWWLPGFLYHQGCQDLRKGNCPKRKLKVLSFHVLILPSELVSGIQEHVDAWCLAVSKHTLEDDLYVSWNFLLLNLCIGLFCMQTVKCQYCGWTWKWRTFGNFFGTFRSCEELRMFTKHSEVAEGGMLSISYVMLLGCLPLYNLLSV